MNKLLNEYKKKNNLTNKQLSILIGVNETCISRWLNNHNKISTAYQKLIQPIIGKENQ